MKFLYFLVFGIIVNSTSAQWSTDPGTNFNVCDVTGEQVLPKIALTSDGGCYIAWFDTRTGNYNVYLQRLDAAGNKLFAIDGLLVSDNTSNSYIVDWDMICDADDNAVIAFSDIRAGGDFKIYAYLISPSGNFLWGANGVSLSTAPEMQPNPRIAQTTDGFYIITWPTLTSPSKIAVQKLDVAGNKIYGNDPLYITSGTSEQYTYPVPIASDNGNYIIGFEGTTGSFPGLTVHLYAQKYSTSGTPQWGSSPVTIADAGGIPFYETTNVISDGSDGIVFVWYDDRDMNNLYSTFVQRVNASGNLIYNANGVEVSSLSTNHHLNPAVVIDPSSFDVYAFWIEQNSTQSMAGISGQKVSLAGSKLWGTNGMIFKAMDSNTDLHMSAQFISGNSYVYYLEYVGATQNNLAKAFSVNGNGNFNWAGNIVTFSTVVSPKSRLVSDIYSNGVSVMAWSDERQDAGGIYAQNIQADGTFGGIVPVELTSFTASVESNDVILKWQTATETNNSGFEILRSVQNNNFEWKSIGFIPGYGTTTIPSNYSFVDENVYAGLIRYQLKQIDFDGRFSYSNIVEVNVESHFDFFLAQNYPNPFNPSTSISYQIPNSTRVTLKIFNELGVEVARLVEEVKPAGNYDTEFDASSFPSGVYFYQLKAGTYIQTKKMLLIK